MSKGGSAPLHLPDGVFRNESGRSGRAPVRGRLFALARDLRRLELKNALMATESTTEGFSSGCMIVTRNARDVTSAP